MSDRPRGVIVEGPDCAGKTTLVKKLKVALAGRGWDVLQMGHVPGNQFERYAGVYLSARRLVLDRSHFSETVYGNLLRGGRHFAPWQRAMLDGLARDHFVTVLCTAPADVLRTRQVAREWPAMYRSFEDTMRQQIADRSLADARDEFANIVAPAADVVCEALTDSDLDRGIDAILERLKRSPLWAPLEAVPRPSERRLVLIEGRRSLQRSTFALAVARALGGWRLVSNGVDDPAVPFSTLMSEYLRASHVVFDGTYLSHQTHARSAADQRGVTDAERGYLNDFARAHALVVICEDDATPSGELRSLCEQSGITPLVVRLGLSADHDEAVSTVAVAATAESFAAVL